MTDVLTLVIGLVKQTIGANRNTWGSILNANMDLLEGALAGATEKAVTGGSVTLSDVERRKRILIFSGTLASNQTIVVENLKGVWLVRNATTGSHTLSMKTSGGSAVEVPQGGWCTVWCDGSNVVYVGPSTTMFTMLMKAADAGYSFANDTDCALYLIGANNVGIKVNNTKILDIAIDGLGITGNLAVSGNQTIAGTLSVAGLITQGGVPIVPIGFPADWDGIFAPNGWVFRYGQSLNRSTHSLLFAALTATATATKNGTTTLSSVSVDFSASGIVGAYVEGIGINIGTTITAVTSNSITLSHAASGSGSIDIRIIPHGQGDGSTTFNVPDDRDVVNPGRSNMGGTSKNLLTNAQPGGIDGDKLGSSGGLETNTLTEAKLPVMTKTVNIVDPGHSHPDNGTSGGGGGDQLALFDRSGFSSKNVGSAQTGITASVTLGGDEAHNNVQPSRISNKIIFTGVFS